MGLLVILLASALARPLDTADASTVGVGMMQVEAGSELAPSTLPQLPVGISVGLSDRVDVITGVAADGVRPVSGGLGTKWLLRDGSARGGPGLAVEAFADVLAEEAAVAIAFSQAWGGVALHLSGDAAAALDGSVAAGGWLAAEVFTSAPLRPVAEVRMSGVEPGALLGVVASPTDTLALDASVFAGPRGSSEVRVGMTWAADMRRRARAVREVAGADLGTPTSPPESVGSSPNQGASTLQ